MQLFNSLSQQIETFVAHNDEVKLYVCGVTPADFLGLRLDKASE